VHYKDGGLAIAQDIAGFSRCRMPVQGDSICAGQRRAQRGFEEREVVAEKQRNCAIRAYSGSSKAFGCSLGTSAYLCVGAVARARDNDRLIGRHANI
jgi:hypothetical protein